MSLSLNAKTLLVHSVGVLLFRIFISIRWTSDDSSASPFSDVRSHVFHAYGCCHDTQNQKFKTNRKIIFLFLNFLISYSGNCELNK